MTLKHEILITTMWESFSNKNSLFSDNVIHSPASNYDHGTLITIIKNMAPQMFFAGQNIVKMNHTWRGLYFIIGKLVS